MMELTGSALEFGMLMGGVVAGFLAGLVVGYKLHTDDGPYLNPTDPRTRPSDYPTTNAGFGPDYPFDKKRGKRG